MKRLVLPALVVLAAALWLTTLRPEASGPPERIALRPNEQAWVQRTFPHDRADPAAYRAALAHTRALRSARKHNPLGAWQFAGPENIGGRISDLAFDPSDAQTVYAAAATGGVFKSTDRGASWLPIFDDQAVMTVGALAVDPSNPQTLYVGTGEANGGSFNVPGGGVYKSTDGGATWAFSGLGETASIGRMLVHPTNPERVYAAAVGSYFGPNPERGVYRSDDGGGTWDRVLFVNDSTGVVDLVMRPDNPDVLFATSWQRTRRLTGSYLFGAGSGIWRSDDGGDTWARLGPENGLPDPARLLDGETGRPRIGRIGLAICRDVPGTMYALYNDGRSYASTSLNDGFLGLYRSDDGGATWYDFDPDRRITDDPDRSAFLFRFSWFFGQVRVHPQNPDEVWVLDVDLVHTTNGGLSWTHRRGTHVDHHALAFAPDDPTVLLEGNDGGVAISTDGGAFWQRTEPLPITQFYSITIDPNSPARLYGGTQDNGTVRTRTGNLDDWEALPSSGDGFAVIVDPTDPNTVYYARQFGLLLRDQSSLFSPFPIPVIFGIDEDDPRNVDTPVVMDPGNHKTLYYGTNRIYRSEQQANSWAPISPVLTKQLDGYPLLGTLTSIAVAPTNSDVIYAGTDDGNLWVSGDYGATWNDITTDNLPFRWITRVVVDPTDEDIAYATFSGIKWKDPVPHVFRTDNRGATWTDITANLPDIPVNAFAVDPEFPEVLYLGNDVGAFVSFNAGGTWDVLGEGLPAVPVFDMEIHPGLRFLAIGTYGRAMYTLDLDALGVATAPVPRPAVGFALEAPYPNPFAESATVPLTLAAPGRVRVTVYDVLGRRLRTLADGPLAAGQHRFAWDARDDAGRSVASGTYLLRAESADGHTRTHPLTVVR